MFVLNGYIRFAVKDDDHVTIPGDIQLLFTENERAVALAIAKSWLERGWEPFLFHKTHGGKFRVLFNFRNHVKQKQAA